MGLGVRLDAPYGEIGRALRRYGDADFADYADFIDLLSGLAATLIDFWDFLLSDII